METQSKLKKLEKITAAVIYQTGIVDIALGMILIVASLAMIFDDISYYIDILFVVPVLFIIIGVRYIAAPRMGTFKLKRKRMRRNLWFIATVTAFLLAMIVLRFVGNGHTNGGTVGGRWIISGIIFMVCAGTAYFLNFRRMYLYALLYVAAFNLAEEVRESPGILPDTGYAYLIASFVPIVIGSVLMISFLQKYPLPENISYDR